MSIPSATVMQFQPCVRVKVCVCGGKNASRLVTGGQGSVDEKRAGEFNKVESCRQFAALAVEVGLHV